jgi:hypothetical protein
MGQILKYYFDGLVILGATFGFGTVLNQMNKTINESTMKARVSVRRLDINLDLRNEAIRKSAEEDRIWLKEVKRKIQVDFGLVDTILQK